MPGLHRASCGTTSTGAGHSFCQRENVFFFPALDSTAWQTRGKLTDLWLMTTYDLFCPDLWPGAASSLPMRQPKHPPACQKRAHERRHGASNKDVVASPCYELNGCPIAWWISVTPINPYPRNIRRILCVGHLRCVELIALSTSTQGCADGGKCYAAQENSTVKDAHALPCSDPSVFFFSPIIFSLFWIRVMPTSGHWPLWCWHLLLCSSRGLSLISAPLAWGPFQTKYGKGMRLKKWERSQQVGGFIFQGQLFAVQKMSCKYVSISKLEWKPGFLEDSDFYLLKSSQGQYCQYWYPQILAFARIISFTIDVRCFSLRWLKSARLVPPASLRRGASGEELYP